MVRLNIYGELKTIIWCSTVLYCSSTKRVKVYWIGGQADKWPPASFWFYVSSWGIDKKWNKRRSESFDSECLEEMSELLPL